MGEQHTDPLGPPPRQRAPNSIRHAQACRQHRPRASHRAKVRDALAALVTALAVAAASTSMGLRQAARQAGAVARQQVQPVGLAPHRRLHGVALGLQRQPAGLSPWHRSASCQAASPAGRAAPRADGNDRAAAAISVVCSVAPVNAGWPTRSCRKRLLLGGLCPRPGRCASEYVAQCAPLGSVPSSLQMMPSMISSAPPPIDTSRLSR